VADERIEREQIRRRLLGWSVACEPIFPGVDVGRDLVFTGGGGTPVDLARVESIDALGQSLSLGLTTALGSDVFNTSFGFDGLSPLADEPDPLLARERVRISVIKLLGSDPRVRRIIDVNLGDERLGRPAPGSRILDVNVAFETVSQDQASVNLGRVVPGA
jgi:hypothetical protein